MMTVGLHNKIGQVFDDERDSGLNKMVSSCRILLVK